MRQPMKMTQSAAIRSRSTTPEASHENHTDQDADTDPVPPLQLAGACPRLLPFLVDGLWGAVGALARRLTVVLPRHPLLEALVRPLALEPGGDRLLKLLSVLRDRLRHVRGAGLRRIVVLAEQVPEHPVV